MPEPIVATKKQCRKCGGVFPETREYFNVDNHRVKSGVDVFTTQCKTCRYGGYLAECRFCGKSLKGLRRKAYCSLECRVLDSLGGIGHKHGRLTILKYAGLGESEGHPSMVLCLCDCGTEKILEAGNILSKGTQSCGCWRIARMPRGEKHPGWKGGRTFDKNGYVKLHMPGHPNAYADNTVLEHIFVMSAFLGRPIRTELGENVHHKNGVKADNRLDNLELWKKSQPSGQRIEDLVAHARYLLDTYAADAYLLAQRQTTEG